MATAAWAGHLHVVQGLRTRDYRWGTDICMQAARSGNLELLKWCLLIGCPWSWPKAARNDDFGGVVQLDVVHRSWRRGSTCGWRVGTHGGCEQHCVDCHGKPAVTRGGLVRGPLQRFCFCFFMFQCGVIFGL